MNSDYRKDWRTDEQFARDILDGVKAEREIVDQYATHLLVKYGMASEIIDNGTDNSGKVVDSKLATMDADFIMNGVPLEVKYINDHVQEFRFKADQARAYVKQQALVLLVNGWRTDQPEFAVIQWQELQKLMKTRNPKPFEPWGYKLCYFLKKYHFSWHFFEK